MFRLFFRGLVNFVNLMEGFDVVIVRVGKV